MIENIKSKNRMCGSSVYIILICSRETDLNTDWPSWAASRPVRFLTGQIRGVNTEPCLGHPRLDKNITISQAVSLMSSPASPGLLTLTLHVCRSQILGQRNRFGVDKDINRDINPVRWIKLSKLRDLMRSPATARWLLEFALSRICSALHVSPTISAFLFRSLE